MSRSIETYTVILRPDDNGTFVAYVPAIEGCHAWGQTRTEAQSALTQVFAMICEEYQEAGRNFLMMWKIFRQR